jgi:hypothetical protein
MNNPKPATIGDYVIATKVSRNRFYQGVFFEDNGETITVKGKLHTYTCKPNPTVVPDIEIAFRDEATKRHLKKIRVELGLS